MPTPLRQALALLTLASLTLLPPLTMAQTTAPLPPAEPMAQEVGALWDPATITPLKLLNIDLFSRSELGQPVVVQPVIPYPSVGGGSFAYCLETLDGLQSRLVEGIVCTDGFTLVRSLEMTFDEALALQAQFDISSGPAPGPPTNRVQLGNVLDRYRRGPHPRSHRDRTVPAGRLV